MRVVGKCKQDDDGNFISVYAVLMDVTDQKQDEQRKNDFIAMVSHELKTPLTSMKAYIQVLQLKARKDNIDFAGKALEGVDKQIGKMTKMVNGFLNVARLESGKIGMDLAPVELTKLVSTVVDEYMTMGSGHYINQNFSDELFINADVDKLGQVVNNLISNAIKYSPNHTEIFIDCFSDDQNAIFKIKDLGMGISQADLP